MTDSRTRQALDMLNDTYEDQLFRIAIGNITADAEGEALRAGSAGDAFEAPSPAAQRRYLLRLDRTIRKRKAADRVESGRRRRVWSKAAAVLLAVIALFALLMLTVSAFRTQVLNLLLKMEPKYTSVQLTGDAAAPTDSGLTLNWKNAYVPTYIPQGFEVTSIENSGTTKKVNFTDPKSSASFNYLEYQSSEFLTLDTENADSVRHVRIHGNDGTLIVKDSTISLTWVQDSHFFMVFGSISADEAVRIAENVVFMQ
jgi:hypothetical protein